MKTIAEILSFLDGEKIEYKFVGNKETKVTGFSSLSRYKTGNMTWIKSEKNIPEGYKHDEVTLAFIQDGVDVSAFNSIITPESKRAFFSSIEYFFYPEDNRESIGHGTYIGPNVKIGYNVKIGHNCSIDGDITIGDNTEIWDNVIMRNKIEIGANSTIQSGVCIGHDGFAFTEDKNYIKKMVKHYGGVRIGDNVFIGAHSTIIRGTIDNTEIGEGVKIDAFCLVAHNVVIENHAAIYGGAVLGGSVHIEPYAHVVSAIVKNQIRIGGNALVGTGSVVVKDVEPNVVVAGNLARAIDKRTPIKMND